MLRLGTHIRLTAPEIAYLIFITNIDPGEIRSLADLKRYIRKCKRHYWGTSWATKKLHRMIDEAYQGCLDGSILAAL
ncbi:hypothetical protein [Pseudoduganella namucuonensis]|uniref:Uncharacterized protein n=1 Tax=Pseudoduganella namucuonensis TaxID=1035707 RepID=A0A1I7M4C9_9BURK|nr:hypothetical protein [Pseudoduganella namucuonensis]SFV16799.1 hypothetical protein SAMN05216552_105531 [Pseudoduganella namucuonensis]